MMKLSLVKEAKRVFTAMDYRKRFMIPAKDMHRAYMGMSTEDHDIVGRNREQTFRDTQLPDFIALLADGKSLPDMSLDEITLAHSKLECWDLGQQRASEE